MPQNKTIEEEKRAFEVNMLDGDSVANCGGAMLSAESVWEYFSERLHSLRNQTIRECIEAVGTEHSACHSGMCGHRDLGPNSVEHGRYIGRNQLISEAKSNLEALIK